MNGDIVCLDAMRKAKFRKKQVDEHNTNAREDK